MRPVVLQMGVTVDGYVAGQGDWGLPDEHPDVRAWKVASLRQVGTHIMGRVTYEEMAGYWPSATGEYADFMNNLPKVVFSATLSCADWADSRIACGDLAAEIAALKSSPGDSVIMAHGGAAFVQALSRLGLIDEYRLVIMPVALGNGLPLFKDLAKPLRVDLAEARTFADGTVIHVYRPISLRKRLPAAEGGWSRRPSPSRMTPATTRCGSSPSSPGTYATRIRCSPGSGPIPRSWRSSTAVCPAAGPGRTRRRRGSRRCSP